MDMYDAKQLYDRLKVSEREDGILDLDARLRAMNGPLLAWYEEHARILPWRENPEGYRVWVSEIMLQQTRVEAVKPYFERFLEALPDVASLASVEDDRLMKLWEGLGYYNRARNLKKAAGVIMEEYGGKMPEQYEQLYSRSRFFHRLRSSGARCRRKCAPGYFPGHSQPGGYFEGIHKKVDGDSSAGDNAQKPGQPF